MRYQAFMSSMAVCYDAMTARPVVPTARQSRIVGALLGLHAGDSLGATFEFASHAAMASRRAEDVGHIVGGGPFSWAAGQATDDTDMARGVLLAYRDRGPGDDVARLAGDHFVRWLLGDDWPGRTPGSRPVDIGAATLQGLDRYRRTRDPDRAGAGPGSAGNGSLMRCLATGLFQPDRDRLEAESMRISRVTHDDARCTVSCAVYNTVVAELVQGTPADGAVAAGEAVAARLEDGGGPVLGAVRLGRRLSVADMARDGPPAELEGRCTGYVLETLAVAVAAVLDARRLRDVLVDVVRIGGDTDTNAAVAGGLLGARHGAEAVPAEWVDKLQFAAEFRETALAMAEASARGDL